ncbi:MAG TPA: amino acid adenylation domain-containing protein [Isosphaeraceae bacterium]|jgi:amino acid adenylation domain-containing protein|nr:amino acid adenylation domain-containing protein [Isosphaeraceae bacterium]
MDNGTITKAPALSPEQKRALLAKLLREKGAGRGADRVSRMVEDQAARTPEAVAVEFEGRSLSYRDLNARANRLAHHLRALGVGADVLVGLFADRSVELVVGMLGVLKAGGAYVPLDPDYPADRLAYMLDDARVPVVLTQRHLADRVADRPARLVLLDDETEFVGQPDSNPVSRAEPGDLAYVIYTSGSTGRPKGVMIPHGALSNFLRSLRQTLGLNERDTLLAVTTPCFDIAALEIFLPLVVGARLAIASREVAADGARLAEAIATLGVTFLQATPATWRLLLEAGWQGDPSLTILCGGEALPRDLADRLLTLGQGLWNLYGPTETTIWSALAKLEPGTGPVPIGRPIAETQLHVLDARLRSTPAGVVGELYIGGAGLARGYLGRPGLTAERFLPDPVGNVPGARVYRTGDLARWRPDGQLECLGRVDDQVKIRGFRVELGEVEEALRAHPAVRAAVAAASEDGTGERRLVGYVVAEPGPSAAELRAFLKQTLPDYMIPSAFVALPTLPLTPNGKVDRKALPAPEASRLAPEGGYVAPRGPIEDALAGIWGEILGVERVGIAADVFELGGHSLMAAQVGARVRDLFGVELPLRDLFEAPTVAGQARRLEEALRAGKGPEAPPLRPVPRDGTPPPASFAQQRLWFLDQLEPGSPAYNVPAAVRIEGDLDVAALVRALNEVIRRHEALRTTFAAEGGAPVQVIAPTLEIPLPVIDLTDRPEAERADEASRIAAEESQRPFDLARGPLVRAALVRLSPREHVALVNSHHIVTDGWSIGVFIHETATLYDAFARALPSPLPEPPVQYADYAAWQRDWLRGEALQAHVGYWQARLADLPDLALPTDRPRTSAASGRGGQRSAKWPAELLKALRDLGREEGATLFMVALAGLETLLNRYTGQEDFAVGTPVAGRTRPELEGLIGFFANTLPLRADFADDPSFRALLRRAKAETLDALAHQDLPFDRIIHAVRPGAGAARAPLFRVMFAFQNAPLPALEAPGLKISPLTTATGAAKFDLTLSLIELGGQLQAELEYDADLFDPETADRLLAHLRLLLDGAVAEPDRPVGTLPMLTDDERRRLIGAPEPDNDPAALPDDLDHLSVEELDALLAHLEAAPDAHDL